MQELFNNKEAFLAQKPKKIKLFLILLLLGFSIIIYYSIKTYTFDNYRTKGVVICEAGCIVKTYIPRGIKIDALSLNNKKINYQIISEELMVDEEEMASYTALEFTTKSLVDKEIVDLTFYYHKQRIIVKIKEIMF